MVGDDCNLTKSDTCEVCPHPCAKVEAFLQSIINQGPFAPDGTFGNV